MTNRQMEASWLEISLTVNGEMAEAVAAALGRYIPEGIVFESTAVTANDDDSEGRAVGPLRVFGYLPMDSTTETKRHQIEEALWYLGRIIPLPAPQYRLVHESDWAEAWKQHYQPITIGRSLLIMPSWLDVPTEGRIPVRLDPGMAFGTGTHPSTQLCLEIIDELLGTKHPEDGTLQAVDVIDLGCGSGILAIAALKLGARSALAVDIDAQAVRVTRQNAEVNGVADRLEAGLGSMTEILAGNFSIQVAHLVLANILAPVLERLLEQGLGHLLIPGGNLVLSGILERQVAELETALHKSGLWIAERRQQEDWVTLRATTYPSLDKGDIDT